MNSCHASCKGAAVRAGHQCWLLSVTLLGGGNPVPELPVRPFIDRPSLRVSAAAIAVVLTFYPVLSFAQSVPAGVTRIIPDGRTATTVTTTGSVTTGTVSGANAFKSFSMFAIGAGNTGLRDWQARASEIDINEISEFRAAFHLAVHWSLSR